MIKTENVTIEKAIKDNRKYVRAYFYWLYTLSLIVILLIMVVAEHLLGTE